MTCEEHLAPYAQKSAATAGRQYPETEHSYRSAYQRDRDRIVHSTAFRRMEYKTQVFLNHEGDHYRTRLTHTIEVMQIARTIARALRLNEDLAEAIALSHDLGHTPFGHAGEDALNELMKGHGGFEHNLHGLRVVDLLEERYPDHPGLNLTYEVREAFVKHETKYDAPARALEAFAPDERPVLEAQAVNLADTIAYDAHDMDDGLYSGLAEEAEVLDLPLSARVLKRLARGGVAYGDIDSPDVRRKQFVRGLIDLLVSSTVDTTERRLAEAGAQSVEDVRAAGRRLVAVGEDIEQAKRVHEEYLFEKMYKHYRVNRMMRKSKRFLKELFQAYVDEPEILPEAHRLRAEGGEGLHRVAADYIAGMTDRFAQDEYRRVFFPHEGT
ncbi:MAG: deoxyguanosinetriphosphate triphosphohydrolase [Planctomycetes bacterium]|nr:deoxyguanosinetriphosphate triphosphohydrolase [Planctomycetota bacterium]